MYSIIQKIYAIENIKKYWFFYKNGIKYKGIL